MYPLYYSIFPVVHHLDGETGKEPQSGTLGMMVVWLGVCHVFTVCICFLALCKLPTRLELPTMLFCDTQHGLYEIVR